MSYSDCNDSSTESVSTATAIVIQWGNEPWRRVRRPMITDEETDDVSWLYMKRFFVFIVCPCLVTSILHSHKFALSFQTNSLITLHWWHDCIGYIAWLESLSNAQHSNSYTQYSLLVQIIECITQQFIFALLVGLLGLQRMRSIFLQVQQYVPLPVEYWCRCDNWKAWPSAGMKICCQDHVVFEEMRPAGRNANVKRVASTKEINDLLPPSPLLSS